MSVLVARGRGLLDAVREQGRLTAASRGAQVEDDRRHAEAATGTGFDDLARRMLVAETARLSHARLDAATQDLLAAYADGFRAGLAPADRAPGRFEEWSPLAVFSVHHVLFGTFGHHLWRRHVARALGPAAVLALAHEVPVVSGSNAWAVGGGRTASGWPLLAADPHRLLTFPGVYQRVRLVCDELDVVGLTFPGVPGVQHFGHTGSVAWAVTNAMADTQDVLDVLLRDDGTGTEADLGDGWEPADVRDGVVVTRLGPVVLGSPAEGSGLVLRSTTTVSRDLGLGAVLPLLRARTAADVDAALDRWVDPVNDVLVADTAGRVLRRVAGRVPLRSGRDWLGWAEPDREEVAPDGHVVSANHRRGPASDVLASEFAPPHRARRLEQLLAGRTGLVVDDAVTIETDTLLLPAATWQARLAGLPDLDAAAEGERERLLDWDGRMDAGSAGAALFAALRGALVRRLVRHPALAPLSSVDHGLPGLLAPWLRAEPRIALALDRWLSEGAPFGIDLDAELAAALDEVAGADVPATWGETHVARPPGRDPVALAGDDGCVLSTASLPGLDDTCWRGPVARVVWDLGDRASSRWSVPDDVDAWAAGVLDPVGAP